MRYKINILVFCFLLFTFFSLTVILPSDKRSVKMENRDLAKIPSLSPKSVVNGSFANGFETYLSDKVGFRSYLIQISDGVISLKGFSPKNGAQIVAISNNSVPITKPITKSTTTKDSSDNNVAPMQVGSVLTFKDKIMEIFKADEKTEMKYANVINSYRAELGDNVKIFSMVVPTQIEFQEDKYKNVSDSEKDAISLIDKHLDKEVTPVDVYSALEQHKDKYIFFKTDHHWTALGSYYAYLAFAKAAGFAPITMDYYDKYSLKGFLGYLYNAHPYDSLKNSPDTISYYKIKTPITTSLPIIVPPKKGDNPTYLLFLGGDYDMHKYTTSVKNGRTLCIIKDSYANCFVPWTIPNYEYVITVDPRFYKGSIKELLGQYKDVDLVFFNYALTTTFADFVQAIDNIK